MSADSAEFENAVTENRSGVMRWIRAVEDGALSVAMFGVIALPLLEALLRSVFGTGITGASSFVQHFTLFIGMLGGALAARESKLLSLASASTVLKGKWRVMGRTIGHGVGAAVTGFLLFASVSLVQQEIEGGKTIAYGIGTWMLQLVMPLGFLMLVWRLIRTADDRWHGRLAAGLVATLTGAVVLFFSREASPMDPEQLVLPALGLVFLAAALGTPIYAVLGGVALVLFGGRPGRLLRSL
jgi:TRAP-type C4-dicarboxylate transport system permease small subunit